MVYITWPAFLIFPIPRPCPWAKSAAITRNRIKVFISDEILASDVCFNCSTAQITDYKSYIGLRSTFPPERVIQICAGITSNESQQIILNRVQFTGKGGNLEVSVYAICAHCPGWGCGQWAHMRKGGSWYVYCKAQLLLCTCLGNMMYVGELFKH